jgi:5-methylcytosine-specific restriction endonuclease McrA
MRREFSTKIKAAAFQRANLHCEKCTAPLYAGKFAYDHVIADAMGGKPTLDNCEVLCVACHSEKTCELDIPRIAKAKRQSARHHGAKQSKWPRLKWKRKVSGETVLRATNPPSKGGT